MRKSVLLFCLASFSLCLVIVLSRHRPAEHQVGQHAIPSTVKVADSVAADSTGEGQTPNGGTNNTNVVESLIRQITAAIHSTNPGDQAMIFTNQFLALIKLHPWAAARFAESPEAGDLRTELMRVIAETWATTKPSEAAKWIEQLSDPNERDTMLGCLCFKVAQVDVPGAIEVLEKEGLDDRREVMLCNLVQSWAANDIQSAFAWVNEYPPGKTRDDLVMHIALAENQTDPKSAAQIVATQINPGETQDEAAFSVVDAWAWQDLPGASAWVAQFPDGDLKTRATSQLSRIAEVKSQLTGQ